MTSIKRDLDQLEAAGVAVLHAVITRAVRDALLAMIDGLSDEDASARKRREATFARRNLLRSPGIRDFAGSDPLRKLVEPILGRSARAVRSILFDKTPEANWLVPWHQDLSIAVKQRIDLPGFGPWSVKAGVPHVQPPLEVLRQMLTIRVHLDDCFTDNGPLRVVPATHGEILSPDAQARRIEAGPIITCEVPAGGALVMRPMLLHSSLPARSPAHRRVVHIEYAAADLPGGLRWYESEAGESAGTDQRIEI